MKSLFNYTTSKLDFISNNDIVINYPTIIMIIQFILDLLIFILIAYFNYYMIIFEFFSKFYVYLILVMDTKICTEEENKERMANCVKRWFCYIFLILFENIFLNLFESLVYFSIMNKIWTCILTIYIILIAGPSNALQLVVVAIYKSLNTLRLLNGS